jgi:hypothetical protein
VCLGGWRGEVVLNKNNDFYAVYFVKKLIIMLFFLALNLALLLKLANRHLEMQQSSNFHEPLVIIQIFNTKALLQMNI